MGMISDMIESRKLMEDLADALVSESALLAAHVERSLAYQRAATVVASDFVRRKAIPGWLPRQPADVQVIRNGPYTVAICDGTDGVLRVGCSRKHPKDDEDPFVGARYAIGRLLGQG